MSQPERTSSLERSAAIHPLDILNPKWTRSRQSIHVDRFIVQHDLISPAELECPPLTHHLLVFALNYDSRHVSRIGEQNYEGFFPTGNFLLQPSACSAFYSCTTTDEAMTFMVEPDFLSRTAAQTECLNPDNIELNSIIFGRDLTIEYIARSFLTEMQGDNLGGRLYSEALATQFAIHLLRKYCTFPARLKLCKGGLSRSQLRAVIGYIDAYLDSNISLKELAQVSGINSHHHFCRLFKQSTGIAPYQYVIGQRVKKAKQLLKQKDLPLVEIALSCGFSNQTTFSRTFRKCVGTTPKNYRKQI